MIATAEWVFLPRVLRVQGPHFDVHLLPRPLVDIGDFRFVCGSFFDGVKYFIRIVVAGIPSNELVQCLFARQAANANELAFKVLVLANEMRQTSLDRQKSFGIQTCQMLLRTVRFCLGRIELSKLAARNALAHDGCKATAHGTGSADRLG